MSSQLAHRSSDSSTVDIVVFRGWMIEIALGFLFYGTFVTFILYASTFTFFYKRMRPRILCIVANTLVFTTATSLSVMSLQVILLSIPLMGSKPLYSDPAIRNLKVAGYFLQRLNYPFTDTIVAWRAWVLYPDNLLVRRLLILCVIGSYFGTLIDAGLAVAHRLRNMLYDGSEFVWVMAMPLLVTNLVSTGLIAYKAWNYKRAIRINLGINNNPATAAEKILRFLLESGLVYSLIWVAFIATCLTKRSLDSSYIAFSAVMPHISALYPLLISVIVVDKNTRDASRELSSVSHSIQFATESSVHESILPNNDCIMARQG